MGYELVTVCSNVKNKAYVHKTYSIVELPTKNK